MVSTISYAIPVAALRRAFTRCASSAAILRHYGFTNRSPVRIHNYPRSGERKPHPNHRFDCHQTRKSSLNFGVPYGSGMLADPIPDFDSVVLAQFLPLPLIGVDL